MPSNGVFRDPRTRRTGQEFYARRNPGGARDGGIVLRGPSLPLRSFDAPPAMLGGMAGSPPVHLESPPPGSTLPRTAADIAATIMWIASLPSHLNINPLELMPVTQSFASLQVFRRN